jgi:hypothetical protein
VRRVWSHHDRAKDGEGEDGLVFLHKKPRFDLFFSFRTFYDTMSCLAFFAPAMSCVAKRLVGTAHPLSTSSESSSGSHLKRLQNSTVTCQRSHA